MKNKKLDQNGQALVELIIFLPLIFTLYSLIGGFANAINGSINQQKITRSYYYFRAQNSSTIPKPDVASNPPHHAWRKFGLDFIGWADYLEGNENPVAPCYQISFPVAAASSDKCENKYSQKTTQYIRVGTAYGICGATYVTAGGSRRATGAADAGAGPMSVVDYGSCTIE